MKAKILNRFMNAAVIVFCCSLSNCDPNNHEASNHPCNFPDAETENDLRSPYSFKILDASTFRNLVGTTKDYKIHPDSVKLYDNKWVEIDPKPRFRHDNEWIFDNFPPYINVAFNDDQALLDLKHDIFYLKTTKNDTDTIEISFNSCLVSNVLFNKDITTRPEGVQSSATFYFRK